MRYWVGTYAKAGGGGLYPLMFDNGTPVAGEPHPGIANASFAVWSPRYRLAYFVDEQDQGRVAAWRRGGLMMGGGA